MAKISHAPIAALALLALLVLPVPASAQAWFTKEACTVTDPAIDPAVIDDTLMAEIEAGAARIENGIGRFWRITSPEGAVSHLWGTFHSNDPLILDLPDELRAVLAKARVVAVEFDGVARSRSGLEARIRGQGVYAVDYEPERFLNLDGRVIEWIDKRLQSLGHLDRTLIYYTPAGLADRALGNPCNDFAEYTYLIQDNRIQLLGVEAGARVIGLEPGDAMIKTPGRKDRRPIADAIIEAYGSYLGPDNIQARRRTDFFLYFQGRIAESMVWDRLDILQFFGPKKGSAIYAKVHGYLVDERNRNFLEPAVTLLNEGRAIIAVGTFHLPGPNGLVTLFREAGFTVERVWTEGEVATASGSR